MSNRELISVLTNMVSQYEELIDTQRKVIDTLLGLLGQYMSLEELDGLSVMKQMDEAAQIRRETGVQQWMSRRST